MSWGSACRTPRAFYMSDNFYFMLFVQCVARMCVLKIVCVWESCILLKKYKLIFILNVNSPHTKWKLILSWLRTTFALEINLRTVSLSAFDPPIQKLQISLTKPLIFFFVKKRTFSFEKKSLIGLTLKWKCCQRIYLIFPQNDCGGCRVVVNSNKIQRLMKKNQLFENSLDLLHGPFIDVDWL